MADPRKPIVEDLARKFPMGSEVRVNGHGGIGLVIGDRAAHNAMALIVEVSGEEEILYPEQVRSIGDDSTIKTIFKYRLEREFVFEIEAPVSFKPLQIGVRSGDFFLWAEVSLDRDWRPQMFYGVLTGGIIPENAKYVGSLVDEEMQVWHYYWASNMAYDYKKETE